MSLPLSIQPRLVVLCLVEYTHNDGTPLWSVGNFIISSQFVLTFTHFPKKKFFKYQVTRILPHFHFQYQ